MKTIIKTLIFTAIISMNAQVEPILDHNWELEKIVTADSTLVVPEYIVSYAIFNEEADDNFQIYVGSCNPVNGDIIFNDDVQNFILLEYFMNFETCDNEEHLAIDDFFNTVYMVEINQNAILNPFSYIFTTVDSKIYLDITNSAGDVATFWANTLSNENFDAAQFSIYPNPVANQLYIESDQAQIEQIEIYTLNGKQVLNVNYQSGLAIDVSKLAKGMYLVKVQTDNGSLTKKLIKD